MDRSISGYNQHKVVHGGKKRFIEETTGTPILDFSASLNPFPPHIEYSIDEATIRSYPDDTYSSLKRVIAQLFSRHPDEICVGNGSIEIIRAFCAARLRRGDRVAIHQPTFGEYAFSAHLAGAECRGNPEGASVQFICNPNNPTGELLSRESLLSKVDSSRQNNPILFVDEAFIELSDIRQSLVGDVQPGIFIARSLTKSFVVPGLRFGYGFGDPGLIAQIEAVRLPWSVNAIAEAYALEAFRHYDQLEKSRQRILQERTLLYREIEGLGIVVERSNANFMLIHLPTEARSFTDLMLHHGILIRDCTSFGLPRSIRIAVRTREENRRLVEAMQVCLP